MNKSTLPCDFLFRCSSLTSKLIYSDRIRAVVLRREVVSTGKGAEGAFWNVGSVMSDVGFIHICTYNQGTLGMLQVITGN